MRVIIFSLILTLFCSTLFAQRLIYNDKAPHIDYSNIVYGSAPSDKKFLILEFVTVSMPNLDNELKTIESLNTKQNVEVVVVLKEERSVIEDFLKDKSYSFAILHDVTGDIFKTYDVRYVPKSVIINPKNDFIWQGKSSQITDDLFVK